MNQNHHHDERCPWTLKELCRKAIGLFPSMIDHELWEKMQEEPGPKITSFVFNPPNLSLQTNQGPSNLVTLNIYSEGSKEWTLDDFTIESDNPSIATVTWVNNELTITPVAPGDCTIIATSKKNSEVTGNCMVMVELPPALTAIAFENEQNTILQWDPSTHHVPPLIKTPTDGTGTIVWETYHPDKLTLDPNTGAMTVIGSGSARIKASVTENPSISAGCWINIEPPKLVGGITQFLPYVDGIMSCSLGDSIVIHPQINPSDATNKTLAWSFKNPADEGVKFNIVNNAVVPLIDPEDSEEVKYEVIASSTDGSEKSTEFYVIPTVFNFADSPTRLPWPKLSKSEETEIPLSFRLLNSPLENPIPPEKIKVDQIGYIWDFSVPMSYSNGVYSCTLKIKSDTSVQSFQFIKMYIDGLSDSGKYAWKMWIEVVD